MIATPYVIHRVVAGPIAAAIVSLLVVLHQRSRDRAAVAGVPSSSSDLHPSRGSDDDLTLAELEALTLDERLERYLALREHTVSTDVITDAGAVHAQAEYVLGEAGELRDAASEFALNGKHLRELRAIWSEMADVAISLAQLRRTMRRVGVPCPPIEQLIEEKTQLDRGRG